jgi:hypothetical protein
MEPSVAASDGLDVSRRVPFLQRIVLLNPIGIPSGLVDQER